MYDSIEKIIACFYGLNVRVIRIESKRIILSDACKLYQLRQIDNRLALTYPSTLLMPVIKTTNFQNDIFLNNCYYYLTYYEEPSYPLPIQKYMTKLSQLHQETMYTKSVDSTFYLKQYDMFKECLEGWFSYVEKLMDDCLFGDVYHVAYFKFLSLYPDIITLKNFSKRLLNTYYSCAQHKDTCRFCLSLNQIAFDEFSVEFNAFTDRTALNYEMVGKDFVLLLSENVAYENVEQSYLTHFTFEKEEICWIVLKVLCIEVGDFYKDGWASLCFLDEVKKKVACFNKLLKSLQIDEEFLYN